MKKGKLFILSGPSGSGKTTLYEKILALKKNKNKLTRIVSVTTRKKRKGEISGRDYVFVSTKMFRFKQRAGHFLESMKVFDNYYGTPKKSVRDVLKQGKSALLCIDVKGTKIVKKTFLEAVTIFIKTPTLSDLKKRLNLRGSESSAVKKLRLNTAKKEIQEASKYKYIIVNDVLSVAVKSLDEVISSELL